MCILKKRFASLLHRVLVLGHTSHLSPYFKRFQWNISLMTPEKLGGHSQTMELILRDIFDFFSFLATTTLTNKRVKFWINLLIFKVGAPYKKNNRSQMATYFVNSPCSKYDSDVKRCQHQRAKSSPWQIFWKKIPFKIVNNIFNTM